MGLHKAKVMISDDVWKQIEWFTLNMTTEIGALGRVSLKKDEDGEQYFYVDKLYFPDQEVTGATVHFTGDMFGRLLKEHGLKELQKIGFYWHRHPAGSAAHSETDDEDTFETFMSPEAKRPFFIFLQTASSSKGWDEEYRIDIRKPVRATITNDDIEGFVETTKEDEEIEKQCLKIKEKVIVKKDFKPFIKKSVGSAYGNYAKSVKKKSPLASMIGSLKLSHTYDTFMEAIEDGFYGDIPNPNSYDNDNVGGVNTLKDEKVALSFENGQATVVAGKYFEEILKDRMKENPLKNYIRQHKTTTLPNTTRFNIQPNSKRYSELRMELVKLYFIFNQEIVNRFDLTILQEFDDKENEQKQLANLETKLDNESSQYKITGSKEKLDAVLGEITNLNEVEWTTEYTATVSDINKDLLLGEIIRPKNRNELIFQGFDLIAMVEDIISEKELDEAASEDEEPTKDKELTQEEEE